MGALSTGRIADKRMFPLIKTALMSNETQCDVTTNFPRRRVSRLQPSHQQSRGLQKEAPQIRGPRHHSLVLFQHPQIHGSPGKN